MKNYVKITGVKKFTQSKNVLGIDLTGLNTERRGTLKTGISCKSFGENWYITEKGKALFKTYDSNQYRNIRNLRIINELLCAELCKQIDLPCADYEPAHIHRKNNPKIIDGIVSYNFLEENENLLPISAFVGFPYFANLTYIANSIDSQQQYHKINKKQVILDLYKIIVFDYITLQCDRNSQNVNLVFKNREYTVGKLIDNEFAFCLPYFTRFNTLFNNHDFNNILKYYSQFAKTLVIDDVVESGNKTNEIAKEITTYAKINPEMMSILKNTLNNIDIDKAIENLENDGIEISQSYKDYVKQIISFTTKTLSKNLKNKVSDLEEEFLERLY